MREKKVRAANKESTAAMVQFFFGDVASDDWRDDAKPHRRHTRQQAVKKRERNRLLAEISAGIDEYEELVCERAAVARRRQRRSRNGVAPDGWYRSVFRTLRLPFGCYPMFCLLREGAHGDTAPFRVRH